MTHPKPPPEPPYDPNHPTGGSNFNPDMRIDTSHASSSGSPPGSKRVGQISRMEIDDWLIEHGQAPSDTDYATKPVNPPPSPSPTTGDIGPGMETPFPTQLPQGTWPPPPPRDVGPSIEAPLPAPTSPPSEPVIGPTVAPPPPQPPPPPAPPPPVKQWLLPTTDGGWGVATQQQAQQFTSEARRKGWRVTWK